ncbi:MAG TPA: hypothetical protein VGN44_17730 [Candidatus Angelobacter sp.]|jgi:hypothetical protein
MPAAKSAKTKSAKKKTKPAAPKKASQKAASQKAAKKASPKTSKPSAKPDFATVFTALRGVLKPFLGKIAMQTDVPGNYHTVVPGLLHRGKPLYFAGIKTGKNYVSFHLLPVYYSPDLLKGMSPALKKRMQGKACFNFTSIDPGCFKELGRLAASGLKKFKTAEFRQQLQRYQ